MKKHHLNLNLDDEQKDLIARASTVDDDKPHNWARRMVLKAARERLGIQPPGADGSEKKPG